MTEPASGHTTVSRVLLVALDGASSDLVARLAELPAMPNLAWLVRSASVVRLGAAWPASMAAAWTTLNTGCDPSRHGVIDDHYLDHRRGKILPQDGRRVPFRTTGFPGFSDFTIKTPELSPYNYGEHRSPSRPPHLVPNP